MSYDIYDFLGNIGVLLILIMYLFLQAQKISSQSVIYRFLNALGALLILVSFYYKFNLSAFIIENFWLLISIYGIYNYLNKPANE